MKIIIIIQDIDTLPQYGKNVYIYVYPTMDVNFSILTTDVNKKLVDNIFSSKFVLLSMS